MGSLQLLSSVPFLPKQTESTPASTMLALTFSSNGCFSLHNAAKIRRGIHLHHICAVVECKKINENPKGIISGEWPKNFSLLSYDDLCAYLRPNLFKKETQPSVVLGEIMSTTIQTATSDQTLEEVDHFFEVVSGFSVIDGQKKRIGIVSKKDKARALQGLKSKVHEVMSSLVITLPPSKTVLDAAALMLKNKITITNDKGRLSKEAYL